MNVYNHIMKKLEDTKLHMTLLDPASQTPEVSAAIAKECAEAGSGAIMVGGSTGVTAENLDSTVLAIKGAVNLPVILFPSCAAALSPNLDAIYFMMVMNSTDPIFITGEQMRGAPYIKKLGLETIPMGYIIVEPGMTVGRVSKANALKNSDIASAIGYALSAQMFGMKLVYLEAGSGAPEPASMEMISAVKSSIDIPLIVGGGIRSPETAMEVAKAGADVIVTGTLLERLEEPEAVRSTMGDVVSAINSVHP